MHLLSASQITNWLLAGWPRIASLTYMTVNRLVARTVGWWEPCLLLFGRPAQTTLRAIWGSRASRESKLLYESHCLICDGICWPTCPTDWNMFHPRKDSMIRETYSTSWWGEPKSHFTEGCSHRSGENQWPFCNLPYLLSQLLFLLLLK